MPPGSGVEVERAVCEAFIEGLKAADGEGGMRGCGVVVCGRSAAMRARAEARESGEGSGSMSALLVVEWSGGLGELYMGGGLVSFVSEPYCGCLWGICVSVLVVDCCSSRKRPMSVYRRSTIYVAQFVELFQN